MKIKIYCNYGCLSAEKETFTHMDSQKPQLLAGTK